MANSRADIDWQRLMGPSGGISTTLSARLERLIARGELAPGSRIPSERDLAERLGVSRGSVREAIHELSLKGLVERRSGHGTTVVAPSSATFTGSLVQRLTQEERSVLEVMDFREAIEPPIAARAAERATAADVNLLQELLEQMERETSPKRFAELDSEFHHTVARAARNSLLTQLVEVSSSWMRSSRREVLQTRERREASLTGHRDILRAVLDADPVAAHRAMVDHINSISRLIDPRGRDGDSLGIASPLAPRVQHGEEVP